jgi:hypothetical protein
MEMHMQHSPLLSRRQSLGTLASLTAAAAFSAPLPANRAQAQDTSRIRDEDIFQFALNLEYLETEYYLRALTGTGLNGADAGPDADRVTGGEKVPFQTKAIAEFAEECESASPGDPSDPRRNNNLARRSARNPDAGLRSRK